MLRHFVAHCKQAFARRSDAGYSVSQLSLYEITVGIH